MTAGRRRLAAVVLKRVNYGEADLIVSFLTREVGRLDGLARHGRKSRQRFGNVLTPGALVELEFTPKPGRDLVNLEKGDLLRAFDDLSKDLGRLARSGQMIEMVEAFCHPLDPAAGVFDLLLWGLTRLDQGQRPAETSFIFALKLLQWTGFGPGIEACLICGRPVLEGTSVCLAADKGGAVCRTCRPTIEPVSLGALKIMGLIMSLDLDKIDRVRVNDQSQSEVGPFLMAQISRVLGRELKSSRVLEQLARPLPGRGG